MGIEDKDVAEILKNIKEKMCHVAQDFEAEQKQYADSNQFDKVYNLPDGRPLNITTERFKCPEALFAPDKLKKSKDKDL